MKQKFGRWFTIAIFIAVFILVAVLLVEVLKDRSYLSDKVEKGIVTQEVTGPIKTVKTFYAGRTHNNIKIHVKGLRKWIYFQDATDADKAALKEGRNISVEAYPRRPDSGLLVDNEYFDKSVLFSLGYSIDGQEIVGSDEKLAKKKQNNLIFLILIGFLLLLTTAGGIVVTFFYKEPEKISPLK